MMKIGTHNSATGEKGDGLLSFLVSPFYKTQSKTIEEQYNSGCRYFDLHFKIKDGLWVLSSGVWVCKMTPREVLEILNSKFDCIVSLVYEGEPYDKYAFQNYVDFLMKIYPNIMFHRIIVKKPKWYVLKTYNAVGVDRCYRMLDGSSWHSWLHIPYLFTWPHMFNDWHYSLVDFL